MSITEFLMTSMLLMSMLARIAFMALTESDDSASLVIGGVDGLLELFTGFGWRQNNC